MMSFSVTDIIKAAPRLLLVVVLVCCQLDLAGLAEASATERMERGAETYLNVSD